jgi:ribosomal protein S24E
MKVSFDLDSTLSRKDVQEFAYELVKRDIEVWVVTARIDNETGKKMAGPGLKSRIRNCLISLNRVV